MPFSILNVIVSISPIMKLFWEQGGEDPNWGRRGLYLLSGIIGGLGCAYLFGGTDTATMAIASYAGSQALSHLLLIMLNPQPLPPKGKVVTPRYF